jgi:methionyl-tRNA formyltransferase
VRIGIISNTDTFIPFAYALVTAGPQLQVHLFFSPSPDGFVNQKATGFAGQLNIGITEEKNPDDLYKWLSGGNFDVCFMLGYSSLVKLHKLHRPPARFYNIHFGALPAFRGPSPVFWQLKLGVEKIGVTIHEVTEKFDAGPVIWLKETENLPHYNYEIVNQLLSQLCVEGVFYILSSIMNKLQLPAINRDQIKPGYHKRPGLAEVMIDWQKMDAVEICNLIRAGNPWNKGALTFFNGQELKIMDAVIINPPGGFNNNKPLPGTIVGDGDTLFIYCNGGQLININMLFYNNCYLPAYQCKLWGLLKGKQFG